MSIFHTIQMMKLSNKEISSSLLLEKKTNLSEIRKLLKNKSIIIYLFDKTDNKQATKAKS